MKQVIALVVSTTLIVTAPAIAQARGGGGGARGGMGGGGARPAMGGGGLGGAGMGGAGGGGMRGNVGAPGGLGGSMPNRGNLGNSPGGFEGRAGAAGGLSGSLNNPGINRDALSTRPGGNLGRDNIGGASSFGGFSGEARGGFNAGNVQGRDAFENRGAFDRPSNNQLGNFLDLPAGQTGRAATNPATSSGSAGSKSWTTPGGGTVTAGGASGSYTGPRGNTVGGAGAGIKVEGAGGNTYVKGVGGVGATNGTNSAIRAGSVTGVQGRNGYTAINARGVAGVDGAVRAGSLTAVRGPDGNAIVAGRGANFVNGQFVGGNTWTAINGNYRHWNYWSPGWYAGYPGAWWPGRWAVASSAWYAASWSTAGAYCGCATQPVYYDYSTNITYADDGNVYYGEQSQGSAQQYYNGATTLATNTQTTNEEWLPLGVFAIVTDEAQTKSDKSIQLAVNKDGVVRGNFQDSLAGTVKPVSGAVDKQTQRVAFQIEGNPKVVIETGLYNLTNDECPVLVHLGPDQVQHHLFIRLQQPDDSSK